MIDPISVVLIAGLLAVVCALCTGRYFYCWVSAVLTLGLLLAISFSAGYPTNSPFPSHAIVYGLTKDHVWAAPKDNPYPPRSYIFSAPPEWFEERDKRKGQPFEVQQGGQEDGSQGSKRDGQKERAMSDRDSGKGWVIVDTQLPPKDE